MIIYVSIPRLVNTDFNIIYHSTLVHGIWYILWLVEWHKCIINIRDISDISNIRDISDISNISDFSVK